MSPEKQRIAIAEACPKVAMIDGAGVPVWRDRYENAYDSDGFCLMEFDPTDDLNAMAEAEKVLTDEQWSSYYEEHYIVLGSKRAIHATAAQKAEFFLKTLNLWK